MAIFKPQEITYSDVLGGLGESLMAEIDDFTADHCFEPTHCEFDEDLAADLTFFDEAWTRLTDDRYRSVANRAQAAAVLSLICGAFYDSSARDNIRDALGRSATKPDLIEIVTHTASAYCQYIGLKTRVTLAKRESKEE